MLIPSATLEELAVSSLRKMGKKKFLQSIGLSALGRLLEIGKDFKDYEYFYLWNFNKGMDSSLYM